MPTFEEMQDGELDWWRRYLAQPHAVSRIFAIYGYRYLSFFFEEFNHLGRVVDFGSGPISAAYIGEPAPREVVCVDPLLPEYAKAGLLYGNIVGESPARREAYDTALLLNVLDHCEEPHHLVDEAAHSLVHGGAALIWAHVGLNPDSLHRRIEAPEVADWVVRAGLYVDRSLLRPDLGATQFLMKVVKP